MIRQMLLAPVLALSLAFQPAPAVAAPDGEDYAKILLGLAVAGIIAKKIQDDREDRAREEAARRQPPPIHDPHPHRRGELPARCAFDARTDYGWATVYGRQCLQRSGVRVERLPRECSLRIRTDRGNRQAYDAQCLSYSGYTVEARR